MAQMVLSRHGKGNCEGVKQKNCCHTKREGDELDKGCRPWEPWYTIYMSTVGPNPLGTDEGDRCVWLTPYMLPHNKGALGSVYFQRLWP